MSISPEIKFIETSKLHLDPANPRLREDQHGLGQDQLLEIMKGWQLEEIATSIVESHFWAHEALIVVREKLSPKARTKAPVVVEGNRRLAAVKLLLAAYEGRPSTPTWKALAEGLDAEAAKALEKLPTIEADARTCSTSCSRRTSTTIKGLPTTGSQTSGPSSNAARGCWVTCPPTV